MSSSSGVSSSSNVVMFEYVISERESIWFGTSCQIPSKFAQTIILKLENESKNYKNGVNYISKNLQITEYTRDEEKCKLFSKKGKASAKGLSLIQDNWKKMSIDEYHDFLTEEGLNEERIEQITNFMTNDYNKYVSSQQITSSTDNVNCDEIETSNANERKSSSSSKTVKTSSSKTGKTSEKTSDKTSEKTSSKSDKTSDKTKEAWIDKEKYENERMKVEKKLEKNPDDEKLQKKLEALNKKLSKLDIAKPPQEEIIDSHQSDNESQADDDE